LKIAKLYVLSFIASAFVGISYLALLELVHFFSQYESVQAHFLSSFILYVLGIYLNFLLQSRFVFAAQNRPWKSFFLYNFMSAFIVATLSGFFYTSNTLKSVFGSALESVSSALAILIISPISFLVFNLIFKKN